MQNYLLVIMGFYEQLYTCTMLPHLSRLCLFVIHPQDIMAGERSRFCRFLEEPVREDHAPLSTFIRDGLLPAPIPMDYPAWWRHFVWVTQFASNQSMSMPSQAYAQHEQAMQLAGYPLVVPSVQCVSCSAWVHPQLACLRAVVIKSSQEGGRRHYYFAAAFTIRHIGGMRRRGHCYANQMSFRGKVCYCCCGELRDHFQSINESNQGDWNITCYLMAELPIPRDALALIRQYCIQ